MTVLSSVNALASSAVLDSQEKGSIQTSLTNLKAKIVNHFGYTVSEHFAFGSFTRETILPRKMDERSDVDYLAVFRDGSSKPQTYLNQLRRFVEDKYSRSDIKQSHPTIVLELSHIKFELVPSLKSYNSYQIPAPASNWTEWIQTTPNEFNSSLTSKNTLHSYNLKPLIQLVKYWNAINGHVFESSYELEQHLVNSVIYQLTLKEYVFAAFDSLQLGWSDAQWRKDKLNRAKQLVNSARVYDQLGQVLLAEQEIARLLPPVS